MGFFPSGGRKNGERGDFKNRSYVDKKSPHTAVSCGLLQSGGIFADAFSKSLKNPQKGLNTAAQLSSLCPQRRTRTGGGGIRTPVPRHFQSGIYMFSRLFRSRSGPRQTTGWGPCQFAVFSLSGREQSHQASPLSDTHASPAGRTDRAGCVSYAAIAYW